jgi:tRNA (Thr-GGU) A37 N-methylase
VKQEFHYQAIGIIRTPFTEIGGMPIQPAGGRGVKGTVEVDARDDRVHGLFATRAPRRPNPIGLSVVRLVRVSGSTLEIEDVDMLDETPRLDIKPFVPQFDVPPVDRIGWLSLNSDRVSGMRSDDRFEPTL